MALSAKIIQLTKKDDLRGNFGEHPFEVVFIKEFPINSKTGKFKRLEVEV